MNLLRSSATIGGLTMVSRVLALVRDSLMAHFLGAGLESDAFNIAWRLPNLFRALFAEGAFASAFVPMFNRTISGAEEGGEDGLSAAVAFAGEVLSVLFPFLAIFTVVMMVFTAPIVFAITGGFPDGGAPKFELTSTLTQIMFPYLGLISLVSLLGGILNSLSKFWVNAAAPVLLNICMIVGVMFFRGDSHKATAVTQAIAVTVSGVAQLGWLIWSCRRAGVMLRIGWPRLSPDVKQLLLIIWPTAIGAGALQFNMLVSTSLAGRFLPQGSVTWLYFADRVYQLPLALVGIGVGTAILPSLSRQIRSGDEAGSQHTQNRAIELCLFLALPAAAALFICAVPITRGLFQHGVYHASDTLASAGALAAYALGVPAYILIKVLTPGFYARQDTRTPLNFALIAMLVNLVGNLVLIWNFKHVGIALATAAAAWVNVGLLYRALHQRKQLQIDSALKRAAAQIGLATVFMGCALYLCINWVDRHMAEGLFMGYLWLGVLVAIGGLVYLVAGMAVGAVPLGKVRAKFLRRS